MKKLNIRFEEDRTLDGIEVIVRASERDAEVAALLDGIAGKTPDLLTVNDFEGALLKIPVSDIILVSVDGKTVQIVTEKNRYTLRTALQSIEERLESRRFVRISRYEIVNLDKVLKFDFTLAGTLRLELAGGMETWASRRNIPTIRKKLMNRE